MRRFLMVCLALALTSCGWTSATRLIPVSERVSPDFRGQYVFDEYTLTSGRRLGGKLIELVARTPYGTTMRQKVAFDRVRTIRDKDQIRDYYLTETDTTTPGYEPLFNYDLILTVRGIDSSGRAEPVGSITRYELRCSDASDQFDNNPKFTCKFARYSDLMAAVRDALVWMDDPRISLESAEGSSRTEQ